MRGRPRGRGRTTLSVGAVTGVSPPDISFCKYIFGFNSPKCNIIVIL